MNTQVNFIGPHGQYEHSKVFEGKPNIKQIIAFVGNNLLRIIPNYDSNRKPDFVLDSNDRIGYRQN